MGSGWSLVGVGVIEFWHRFTELGRDSWRSLIFAVPFTVVLAWIRFEYGREWLSDSYMIATFYILQCFLFFALLGEGKDEKESDESDTPDK